MTEKRVFQSFKTYADIEPIIAQLTDEEAGRIYKACFGCYFRGETLTFRSDDDRMFRGAWGTVEMKLLSERKKDSETSEKRSAAGREGGLANAKNGKQKQASAKNEKQKQASEPTYTDTVTETISSTDTNSFTGTKQDQADADSADCRSASAAAINAEPNDCDLFSVKQLLAVAKKNKVKLTEEGIKVFHEEMHDSAWILYGEPVKKKFIVRAFRAWAKYHPEYAPEEEPGGASEPEQPKISEEKTNEVFYLEKEERKREGNILCDILHTIQEHLSHDKFNEFMNHDDVFKYIPEYCPKCFFTNEQLEVLCEYAESQGHLGFEKYRNTK